MNLYSSNDLDYIISNLEIWYSDVSGIELSALRQKSSDEFINSQIIIRQEIQKIRKLQSERNDIAASTQAPNIEVIKRTNEIKEMFQKVEKLVDQMVDIIIRQSKMTKDSKVTLFIYFFSPYMMKLISPGKGKLKKTLRKF